MTAFYRAALLVLVIGSGSMFVGDAKSQSIASGSFAETRWMCFYSSDQYPDRGEIGFFEDGGHCPFIRNDPSLGQLLFVRRVAWD